MGELSYHPSLLFNSEPVTILKMQINSTLILADDNFASIEEKTIRSIKIMTKNRKYLTPAHPLQFNGAQIKLDSKSIVLTKKSHIRGIFLITNHVAHSTKSREVRRKKLSPIK